MATRRPQPLGVARLTAHGVDVAQGIRSGDASEGIGVVDQGREEIDGLHHGQTVPEPIDPGVIKRRGTDQKVRVIERG